MLLVVGFFCVVFFWFVCFVRLKGYSLEKSHSISAERFMLLFFFTPLKIFQLSITSNLVYILLLLLYTLILFVYYNVD